MSAMVEGKVVVVTGAGNGIGRAIALAMAAEGARVVVNDLGSSVHGEGQDAGPAQRVVDEIKAAGGEAVASTDSVAGWDSAHRIVQTALDTFGRIDSVVNNAGILRDRMFHKMDEQEWLAVLNVHLNGSFFMARAAAPHFRNQGSGSYIHMTSNTGLVGNVGQVNYAAAKMGIVGMSKAIALDMAAFGVRSNCISPAAWSRMIGAVPTDTPEKKLQAERMERMMHPSKQAPLAVFLASDQAKDVSGQIFYVRANEIMLVSQPRVTRSVHRDNGWTPSEVAEHAIPALRPSFLPLQQTHEVYSWEPV
ncbi:SDR family NAD(P)-dependent oxidoreductase [Pseudomonas citronellolis]|uniref:SDR family NAD(P)-dependent oxidoreductase n=1 Tax=Pseudomonas citronellolis TaxID=53408 RepID=UPI0021C18509|nr:SDR family NAD(P)-dependent oxidoreductase [Pseudomonas citronellolis]UXJ50210.1 SDR family oxidoreductase [Pseudomonas citronellolis]